jgi:hypothetical protein
VIFGAALTMTRLAIAELDPYFVTVGRAAGAGSAGRDHAASDCATRCRHRATYGGLIGKTLPYATGVIVCFRRRFAVRARKYPSLQPFNCLTILLYDWFALL